MTTASHNRKVFHYLDYRKYLRDHYDARKAASPVFSLRTFSDRCGFKTKDFILRVMNGEKNLSAQSAPRVAKGLGLGRHEATFFEALVEFNQSTSTPERALCYERMQSAIKVARFANNRHLLAHHQYQLFSDWKHLAVRSLIGMYGFDGNYTQLANRVHPRIKPEEAKRSVELLETCGLARRDDQGNLHLIATALSTGERVPRTALHTIHQQLLGLAATSLDKDPPHRRNITGLTLGISQKGMERVVERINAFRRELAQIAEEDEDADQVVQMEFLLFPLSAEGAREPADSGLPSARESKPAKKVDG